MKLLSIEQARALWLFPLTDLNPRGKAIEKNGLTEIGERYRFAVSPTTTDVVVAREKNQPLKYLQGAFTPPKSKDAVTVDLLIYRDGIVADTRSSTADSAAFIDDLLTWAHKELGLLSHHDVVKVRTAISSVYVSTDKTLALLNPKLNGFSKALTNSVKGHPGAQFDLATLGFWHDPTTTASQPVPFRFERAAGAPFSENRYFSSAPLETDVHLEALERLEALLTG